MKGNTLAEQRADVGEGCCSQAEVGRRKAGGTESSLSCVVHEQDLFYHVHVLLDKNGKKTVDHIVHILQESITQLHPKSFCHPEETWMKNQ